MVATWVGDTMRRIPVPKKWIKVENFLNVRDFADSIGEKAGYGNFTSIATALNEGGLAQIADSQYQRVMHNTEMNKIVNSMQSYAAYKYNAKLSTRATLPDGQSAALYVPKEKHLRGAAHVPIKSEFWTRKRTEFKQMTDADINTDLNKFRRPPKFSDDPFF